MKNKVLLIIACIVLFFFLVIGTYMWYMYFLRISGASVNNQANNTEIKSGDLVFIDDGNGVHDLNAKSIEDNQIDNVKSYDFQVENSKKSISKYALYIEDLPANSVNDGCSEDTLLKRNQLKYQLSLNGKVIKEDYMSNIKDNILDTRDINGKTTNKYSLKVYIHDGALEWFGKHYHYKVSLGKIK